MFELRRHSRWCATSATRACVAIAGIDAQRHRSSGSPQASQRRSRRLRIPYFGQQTGGLPMSCEHASSGAHCASVLQILVQRPIPALR